MHAIKEKLRDFDFTYCEYKLEVNFCPLFSAGQNGLMLSVLSEKFRIFELGVNIPAVPGP